MNSFLDSERFVCWKLIYFFFWQKKEQFQAALGEPTFALLLCQANDFTVSDSMTHQLIVRQLIAPCKWNKYTASSKLVSLLEASTLWDGRTAVRYKPLGFGKEIWDRTGSSKREETEEGQVFPSFRLYWHSKVLLEVGSITLLKRFETWLAFLCFALMTKCNTRRQGRRRIVAFGTRCHKLF